MKPLIVKLTRPHLTSVVKRNRLSDHLDRASKKKCLWISAPAGYGKTTLVANWLDSRNLPCLWYLADEGDADIATFFSYMGLAVQHVAPRYRTSLPLFTPEYRLGIPTFTKRYFESLYGRLNPPFCLIIDNYQDVSAESLFHQIIRDGLSVMPDGIMMVIISRSDPPPVYSRLQANTDLEVLRKEEVEFTFDESREFVMLRGRKKPAENFLKLLYKMTEGWAAGLVLLLESLACRHDLPERWKVTTDHVFDYFAAELFAKIDEETRRFLLMTAIMPRISAHEAVDLTGNKHSELILSRLSRSNFFTERHATPISSYKYHPLFREFLIAQGQKHFGQDEIFLVRQKAALLLLRTEQVVDAARILSDIGDWKTLTELILQHARPFLAAGRFLTIETWIDSIPSELKERNGWLLHWKAICRLVVHPAEARGLLERAYLLFRDAEDASGAFRSWSAIVETFMYEWKDFHPLDHWINEFAQLQRRYAGFPSVEIEARATSAIFTALMFRQPQHPELSHWTKRVRDLVQSTPALSHRMFIGYNLIHYYLWTGRITEAGALVASLAPIIKKGQGAPLPKLMWLRAEALYYFYVSQFEAGLKVVEQGLQLSQETGVQVLDIMFYGVGIYHATFQCNIALAQHYLDRMSSVLDQGSSYGAIYYTGQSSLVALMKGEYDVAVSQARACVNLTEDAGVPLILMANQAALAHVLTKVQQYDCVNTLIVMLRKQNEDIKCDHIEAWCSSFEAQIAMHEGNDALFTERFSRAVDICKTTGLRLLAFLPNRITQLCSKALELGIEADFVKEAILLNKLVPDNLESVSACWPWPIRIHTLGRFELIRDDTPMNFAGRVQQKPLSMLKALVSFGGKDVREEQLTDALWPDADGDLAHTSFNTTLHRLRNLIGHEKVLVFQDGTLSLDEQYCWIDTWAFVRDLRRGEEAWNSLVPITDSKGHHHDVKAESLFDKALNLYRGHFLPGDAKQPWTLSLREQLRAKFVFNVSKLGTHWMEKGRYDKSVGLFMKGLETDDLAEEFYQHLMVCYNQLGQQNDAINVYRRCRKVLQSSLGLNPSSKTEGIYYIIRQNYLSH